MKPRNVFHLLEPVAFMRTVFSTLLFLSVCLLIDHPVSLSAEDCTCHPDSVTFESLSSSAAYSVGNSFSEGGTTVTLEQFQLSGGTWTSGGAASVDTTPNSGGYGQDMNVSNITLSFNFTCQLEGLTFQFGEYGGNLNITINGDLRNFYNFSDINGLTIGGVNVSVVNGLGNDTGNVTLTGTINSFSVGGQELWLDNIVPYTCCIDFESLTSGTSYVVGNTFNDSGAIMTVQSFTLGGGGVTSAGNAMVSSTGAAGASGLDVNLNNVNLDIDFQQTLQGISLHFGEYGGNLNITINGDFRNFNNFSDIHGLTIGGTQVYVINGLGNDKGKLFVFGTITSFAIGGQELWIDHICPESGCIDFEGLVFGTRYNVGDTFTDSGAELSVLPFTWSNGTQTSAGYAEIVSALVAGGTGQGVYPNNSNLGVDFGYSVKGLTILVGETGGNLNITINRDFRNFENFADIDGLTIGNVLVNVTDAAEYDTGILTLTGVIHSFSIGGQELIIDTICPGERVSVNVPANMLLLGE